MSTIVRRTIAIIGASAALVAISAGAAQADSRIVVGPGTEVDTLLAKEGPHLYRVAECTASATAVAPNGGRVIITAGHCGKVGQRVGINHKVVGTISQSSNPAVTPKGTFVNAFSPDFAVIVLNPQSAVAIKNLGRVAPTFPAVAAVGDAVCSQGITSGWRCGHVLDTRDGFIATDIASREGDSGGPLIRSSDNAILGLLSGGDQHGVSFFYSITRTLGATGLRLA